MDRNFRGSRRQAPSASARSVRRHLDNFYRGLHEDASPVPPVRHSVIYASLGWAVKR